MKKKLLFLLPLFSLMSCANLPSEEKASLEEPELLVAEETTYKVEKENGLPVVSSLRSSSEHVTYLLMSPFGYLTIDKAPVKGEVTSLFYENTIVWKAEAGSPLPTKDQVKSTKGGATFRGWAYYDEDNDNVWPDYLTNVDSRDGLALKAIFDGTDAGGNSGGSSSGGSSTSTTKEFGIKYGSGEVVVGEYIGTNFQGYEEYYIGSASFTEGDTFALYDKSSLTSWTVPINSYSFDPSPKDKTEDDARVASYVTTGADVYTVNKTFTADLYIQIMYQQDKLYIELV